MSRNGGFDDDIHAFKGYAVKRHSVKYEGNGRKWSNGYEEANMLGFMIRYIVSHKNTQIMHTQNKYVTPVACFFDVLQTSVRGREGVKLKREEYSISIG